MEEKNKAIGKGIDRIDGILKITGKANYATDYPEKNIAYAVLFKSTIASGKITGIDSNAAKQS